jgi:hypothetical protein
LNRSLIDLSRAAEYFGLPEFFGIRIDCGVQRIEQRIDQRSASLDRQL